MTGEAGAKRRVRDLVKKSVLRAFIRSHCLSAQFAKAYSEIFLKGPSPACRFAARALSRLRERAFKDVLSHEKLRLVLKSEAPPMWETGQKETPE